MATPVIAAIALAAVLWSIAFARFSLEKQDGLLASELPAVDAASDARFVYGVLERILVRSVDGNRYVDMLLLGVFATDIALLVLLLERPFVAYRILLLTGILAAAGLACAGMVLSVFVREAPDPALFLLEVEANPERARTEHTSRFATLARQNVRIRAGKTIIFVIALLILFGASLVATIGTW